MATERDTITIEPHEDLTIALTEDEANAVLHAVCLALTSEGEELGCAAMDCPGELHRLGRCACRIAALAAIGEALKWRKHWGPSGGTPEAVTAPEEVWVDLIGELEKRAREIGGCEVDPQDVFEFDVAARSIARAYADARAVV